MESFSTYYKRNKAAFDLEDEIIRDKISRGIDGIEWLVLQVVLDNTRKESLQLWVMVIEQFKRIPVENVVIDAFTMKPGKFYRKYHVNWWISIDDSLTYLNLLRERDYDRYLYLLQQIQIRED